MALTGSRSGRGLPTDGRSQAVAVGYPSAAALVVLLMLGSYVVLKPYYLLASGLPQPADMVLTAALPFALLLPMPPQSDDARGFQLFMMLFCAYAAMVSLGWTFALMDSRVARYAAQYAFNLCLLFICFRIGSLHPAATFRVLAYAISLSAMIQAASIALSYDATRLRQIASFNNPNQLGYWSVLSLCIFWMVAREARIKWYIQAPTATCLIYTTLSSLSKASMTAVALLCVFHFLKRPKLLCLGLVALAAGYFALENTTLLDRVSGRLQNIGEQRDDNLQSRGYIRILNYPEYLIVGAGESALYRFGEVDDGKEQHEIHSTLGTILFSYGLIGSAAFVAAMWRLYRLSSAGRFLYLLPPFVYGLTHQGLRFSFLWLLFAVIAVLGVASVRGKTPTSTARSAAPGS